MAVDLIMGALGALIGLSLLARNEVLAAYMKEADDRYRSHPWLQAFEPTGGPLATDSGRITAFRAWMVVSGAAFLAVGLALLGRALV
jgi:hypothetical protein